MTHTVYQKLVRDRIPEIIQLDGKHPHTTCLDREACKLALLEKLVEEAEEAKEADNRVDLITELADLSEVFDAILEKFEITAEQVYERKANRQRERGGFNNCIFLVSVES